MSEIFNPAWPVVRARVEEELSGLRSKLENPDLDFSRTQVVRGEIRALKRLLGLPEDLQAARQPQTAPSAWPDGSDA